MSSFRLLVIFLILSGSAGISHAQSKETKTTSVKIKAGDKILSLPAGVVCMEKAGKYYAGNLSKDSKRFTDVEPAYKNKISQYKIKFKDAKAKNKVKAIQKFRNLILNTKKEMAEIKSSCSLIFTCSVNAFSAEYSVNENSVMEFSLNSTTTCKNTVSYLMTSNTAGSTETMSPGHYKYYANSGQSADSLGYKACVDKLGKCSEEKKVSFIINIATPTPPPISTEKPESLAPYKNIISRAEARHLLKKIALNDIHVLTDDLKEGNGYNLEKLINKLLDPGYAAPDLKDFLTNMRDRVSMARTGFTSYRGIRDILGNPIIPVNQSLESATQQLAVLEKIIVNYARGYDTGAEWLTYAPYSSSMIPLIRGRYYSPLQAQMSNLWYGHFGTAVHNLAYQREYYLRDYVDLIFNNSLGNFKQMILGTGTNSCLSGAGGGILCDPASNFWLSNFYNTYAASNQNYAREVMELYLLGPKDSFTEQPNYGENEVIAATGFLSGFKEQSYTSITGFIPVPDKEVPRFALIYDKTRHDFSEYTAFKLTDYELKGTQTPTSFVEHLFSKHPALPRFIAGKLFRMLAYVNPSEKLVQELADYFKANNYDISLLIHKIATSEAMFSDKAYEKKCVKEPFRLFLEVYRNFEFPMLSTAAFNDPRSYPGSPNYNKAANYNYAQNVWNSFYNTVASSGEKILQYENVFTYDYCGRSTQSFGHRWAYPIYMVNRIKGILNSLVTNGFIHLEKFTYRNVFNQIIRPGEDMFAVTPGRLIEYFNDLYNVELSPEEYEVIIRYITHRMSDDLKQEVQSGWNPSDDFLVNEKIAGLIAIYSSISQSNIY